MVIIVSMNVIYYKRGNPEVPRTSSGGCN